MTQQQAASLASPLDAFVQASETLGDVSQDCVERVNAAWAHLQHLTASDLPPSLEFDWVAVSERAGRLATEAVVVPVTALLEEAADIGTMLLCFGWLARHPDHASSGLP